MTFSVVRGKGFPDLSAGDFAWLEGLMTTPSWHHVQVRTGESVS